MPMPGLPQLSWGPSAIGDLPAKLSWLLRRALCPGPSPYSPLCWLPTKAPPGYGDETGGKSPGPSARSLSPSPGTGDAGGQGSLLLSSLWLDLFLKQKPRGNSGCLMKSLLCEIQWLGYLNHCPSGEPRLPLPDCNKVPLSSAKAVKEAGSWDFYPSLVPTTPSATSVEATWEQQWGTPAPPSQWY